MNHVAAAHRRRSIIAALRNGARVPALAQQHGLTERHVYQIAQDSRLPNQGQGRPRGARWWVDCPPHLIADYDFLSRRKRIPVAEIKEILAS